MNYLLLSLTIIILSCGDRASQTTAQFPVTPEASATPAQPGQVATQTPLLGTYWQLLELNGKNMEGKTAKEMYLLLDPTSPQFKSHSGCNMVMGEAKRSATDQLMFTNLLNTTSECKTPDIDAEFLKAMQEVTGYTLTGNVLVLTKGKSDPVMKFVAKS